MEVQSVQEAESSRSKKARTLGGISTGLSPLQGGSAHNPSDVMMTLIDAEQGEAFRDDKCVKEMEARYGMRGVRVGEASHPGPQFLY